MRSVLPLLAAFVVLGGATATATKPHAASFGSQRAYDVSAQSTRKMRRFLASRSTAKLVGSQGRLLVRLLAPTHLPVAAEHAHAMEYEDTNQNSLVVRWGDGWVLHTQDGQLASLERQPDAPLQVEKVPDVEYVAAVGRPANRFAPRLSERPSVAQALSLMKKAGIVGRLFQVSEGKRAFGHFGLLVIVDPPHTTARTEFLVGDDGHVTKQRDIWSGYRKAEAARDPR